MWNSSWVTMWRQDNAFTCFHRSLSCSSVNQSPLCFSIHSFGNITMDTPIELQWITSLSIHCLQQSEFHFINLMSGFFRFLKSHLSNHSNRLPVEVHQCREVLALWCLCTAGQGHAVAGGAARGRDQRWEAYGITGVDVFWWETRAFWRHLTRWKWRLRDINLCITQYILGKNVTLVDKRLDLNNMKVLGNHHRHFLWYFHVFLFTWCGSSLLNKVTPPEEEDELELVADAPQQEEDDSWLTLVLRICWDAHECSTLQDSITCFSKQRGSGIPLKVTLYVPMWRVVEHQMTVLYWFCYGCFGGSVLCQSGTLDEPEYVDAFKYAKWV